MTRVVPTVNKSDDNIPVSCCSVITKQYCSRGGFFQGIVCPAFAGGAIFSVRIVARKRFFLSFYESLLLKGKFVSVQSMRNCHYLMFLNLLDNLA